MNTTDQIPLLIAKKIKGVITPDELEILNGWLNESDENKQVYQKLLNDGYLLERLDEYNRFDSKKAWSSLEKTLVDNSGSRRLWPHIFMKYAAILLPVIMASAIIIYYISDKEDKEISEIEDIILPGTLKATLVLADGSKVDLEKENATKEIQQGETQIMNDQRSLTYKKQDNEQRTGELIYNELITPIGGTYRVVLSDQTAIVLNAGSSLRFPVEFNEEKRQVFLTGEAYFDVQHDGRPFSVTCDGMDVQVLGTTFNISAYSDDDFISTTLVEGSVRVSSGELSIQKILKPEDQAVFDKQEIQFEIKNVDTSLYTSWVDGKFEFSNESLDVVMRKLSRWYDFEYEFKNINSKDYHFSARISNDQQISTILDMLEMTTDVRFEVNDRKIVIL